MNPITIPRTVDRDQIEAAARALHAKGYNCAQAVACAFAPLMGVDEDLCFRMAEGLGGAAVLGLARSNGCADPTSKEQTYVYTAQLVKKFEPLYGTTTCSAIRALDPTGIKPMKVCKDAVGEAARMTADVLEALDADLEKGR